VIPDEGLTGSGNNIAGTARSRSYGVRPVADAIDGLIFKKDTQMNRRVFIALAVAAMAFSTSTASAGGGGSKTQYVRIKNIGATAVNVVAVNGAVPSAPAYRSLSQNRVTQFILKKGAGTFQVQNPADTADIASLPYTFPNSTYVYLQANTVGGAVQATFAPPGTRF
jgi:hypothetical protein